MALPRFSRGLDEQYIGAPGRRRSGAFAFLQRGGAGGVYSLAGRGTARSHSKQSARAARENVPGRERYLGTSGVPVPRTNEMNLLPYGFCGAHTRRWSH